MSLSVTSTYFDLYIKTSECVCLSNAKLSDDGKQCDCINGTYGNQCSPKKKNGEPCTIDNCKCLYYDDPKCNDDTRHMCDECLSDTCSLSYGDYHCGNYSASTVPSPSSAVPSSMDNFCISVDNMFGLNKRFRQCSLLSLFFGGILTMFLVVVLCCRCLYRGCCKKDKKSRRGNEYNRYERQVREQKQTERTHLNLQEQLLGNNNNNIIYSGRYHRLSDVEIGSKKLSAQETKTFSFKCGICGKMHATKAALKQCSCESSFKCGICGKMHATKAAMKQCSCESSL
jgi:hypothetical protein